MAGLLASPLGLLIGLALGALGGGGSILAVPALVHVAGQTPQAASTTSLVVVSLVSLGGLAGHWRAGRVRPLPGVVFGAAGIAAAVVGSRLNAAADPDVLLLVFAALMLVAALLMHGRGDGPVPLPDPPGPAGRGTALRVLLAGSAVGLLTGLFGVGGGFVIVPALVLALRFPMPAAVGTSLLVIVINSAAALTTRLAVGGIDWAVALPFTVTGLAGVWLGGRIATWVPTSRLTRWFALLLVAVALYTGADALVALAG